MQRLFITVLRLQCNSFITVFSIQCHQGLAVALRAAGMAATGGGGIAVFCSSAE